MFRLDKTKKLADEVQALTEGQEVDSQLGTNNIATPTDDGIEDFNKGAEFGYPHQNHYIVESRVGDYLKDKFGKKKPAGKTTVIHNSDGSQSGSFIPNPPEDIDEPNPFIRPEVTKERAETANKEDMRAKLERAVTYYAIDKLNIDMIEYGNLMHVKKYNPEKLKKVKEKKSLAYISDDEILNAREIWEKYPEYHEHRNDIVQKDTTKYVPEYRKEENSETPEKNRRP